MSLCPQCSGQALDGTRRTTMTTTKRKRGRRVKRTMPEPIDDSPENIMRAVVSTPPKKSEEWRHLRDADPRGFALHPGTRNRYEIRDTRTQHRPPSRHVNDRGRVSGSHRATPHRPAHPHQMAVHPQTADPARHGDSGRAGRHHHHHRRTGGRCEDLQLTARLGPAPTTLSVTRVAACSTTRRKP